MRKKNREKKIGEKYLIYIFVDIFVFTVLIRRKWNGKGVLVKYLQKKECHVLLVTLYLTTAW